jgi:Flp pilus assembly protein TadB
MVFQPSRGRPYNRVQTADPTTAEVGKMPLSDHEQRILEEIEKRLAEEDPRLVEQVGRTDLYTHLARRIRFAALAFVVGALLLLLFVVSVWVAAVGFVIMVLSALLIYRYLGQLGRDQIREMQASGRLTLAGFLGRMAMRFGRRQVPPDDGARD